MRNKKPHIAASDQVRIGRQGEDAVIEYLDPTVMTVHLHIGPGVHNMTDPEILELHNDGVRAQERMAAEGKYVAAEVPPGQPQIRYFAEGDQWCPRGDVLRCVIEDGGPDREARIWIDDQELSLSQFGRLLTTFAGWGMRIEFVPDDEICDSPLIALHEPDDGE